MQKNFSDISVKTLPKSEVEIIGEIDAVTLENSFNKALREKTSEMEIPGFRKGKAPESMILAQFGEMYFLEKAAEDALSDAYPHIIEEAKQRVIGHPKVSITKLARGNPLGFSLKVAVIPEAKLPDYKKIAREVMSGPDDLAVTDEDVDSTILEIRRSHYHAELHRNGTFTDEKHSPIGDEDLPPLTDELVKTFGDFADMNDFREKLKINIKDEKERKAREKKRAAMIERIMEKTSAELPEILIKNETETMFAQFEGDIERAGARMEDYLKTINKTVEAIKKEWKPTAEKKALAQLVLSRIAVEEKISADAEKVRAETEKILTVHQGADPVRARSYVAVMLTNEEVFKFLENSQGRTLRI